ncbi:peptidase S1 [Prauserella marina]|uniref:Putative serine protease PepD n=1 Tax=Prauserella marina TaxID=530584 RepID=A0A222VKY8_9PSEU|nr:peptidase S1 [Prauserella marina]PWV85826.1 putative serine protease PepD [Prauserella marina]SDC44561.1 putative serine protease PepD [Prauserella marina]
MDSPSAQQQRTDDVAEATQEAATPAWGLAAQQQPPHSATGFAGSVPTALAKPKRRVPVSIIATAIIAGLVGGGAALGGNALLSTDSAVPVLTSQPASASNVSSKPGSVEYAAEVAMKSTVDIKVPTGQGTATGTGIILSEDGYVLTNNHVVAGASENGKIQVTAPDGKKYSASVTGTAPSYDLAVIKLDDADGLTPATLGESSGLKVGQQVAAIGSPEELSNTVTSGIVSALSRTVTAGDDNGELVVYNGLQTDAPINPGNSGGPLVNLDGQVVGVNSAVEPGQSSNGGLQAYGLGFSIPIDTAKRIANELMQNGEANKPVLGVSGSVNPQGDSTAEGAQLASVQPGSAAEKAGIRQGDVITKLGDTLISSYADLMAQVLKHTPGEEVPVVVKHADGSTETVNVALESAKDTQQTTITPQQQNPFDGDGGFGRGN